MPAPIHRRIKKLPVTNSTDGIPFDSAKFRRSLVAWFKKAGRDLPWRRTRDPYAILVSEIMLQQTQVVTVLDYYARWMRRFADFHALAGATEPEVLAMWQGLGYYSRARNLHKAAQLIVAELAGNLTTHDLLTRRIPGIGRYTGGAVATFAFDAPVPIVDANIARVLSRIFNVRDPIDSTAGHKTVWSHAEALQPEKNARLFNSALMELGALVCLPRSPKCPACPVREHCRTTDPESLPVKKPRRKTVQLTENSAWIIKNGRILLEQQTGSRWRGLWKLPSMQIEPSTDLLLQITYPFTHHRVTLSIYKQAPPRGITSTQCWFPFNDLAQVAMAAPHRRAVTHLWQG